MEYQKAIDFILAELENKLSPDLLYHAPQHTLDVLKAVELIAQQEGLTGPELALLKVATAFHDAGFLRSLKDLEEVGVALLEEILPNYNFPVDLSGAPIVISIEPEPDNSPGPFAFKPLFGLVPANAAVHSVHSLNNQISSNFPQGSVSR